MNRETLRNWLLVGAGILLLGVTIQVVRMVSATSADTPTSLAASSPKSGESQSQTRATTTRARPTLASVGEDQLPGGVPPETEAKPRPLRSARQRAVLDMRMGQEPDWSTLHGNDFRIMRRRWKQTQSGEDRWERKYKNKRRK